MRRSHSSRPRSRVTFDPVEPIDWRAKFKDSQRMNNRHVAAERVAEIEREKAERAMRDLSGDRDWWKTRALAAEAALKSLGV